MLQTTKAVNHHKILINLFRSVLLHFTLSSLLVSCSFYLCAQSDEQSLDAYFNVGEKEDLSQSFYIGPYIELTEISLKRANLGGMVQLKRHALYVGYGIGWDNPEVTPLKTNDRYDGTSYAQLEVGYQFYIKELFSQYDSPFSGIFADLSYRSYNMKLEENEDLIIFSRDPMKRTIYASAISMGIGAGASTSTLLHFLPTRLIYRANLNIETFFKNHDSSLLDNHDTRLQLKAQFIYLLN